MKRFFSAMVTLLLVLSITACSDSVKSNNQEQNTASRPTAITTESEETSETVQQNLLEQETAETINTEKDETTEKTDNKTQDTTKKTASANKPNTNKKPVVSGTTKKNVTTTKKPVTSSTTKKPVTTTKKPQTTVAQSNKLPNYNPESEIKTLFNKINNYREQNGLKKLTLDPELCKMAYIRAQEQKALKGHTRPDGSNYYSILDEYDYSYMGCGENIAFVSKLSPDEIFNKWKGSSAHNGNMLENRWTKSGIALQKNADGTYTIVHLFAC